MPQASAELHINLFVDGSKSMQGFVERDQENYYLPVVEQLESVGQTGGWSKSDVKWWKFGAKATEIPRSERLVFQNPDFYREQTTQIDDVFAHSNAASLTVVITDLFQSHNDVALMSKKLEDLYLANLRQSGASSTAGVPTAVGIVGIPTRFRGRVCELGDVHGRERCVSHSGILPYYILVLGPLADVERFLRVMDARFPELLPKRQTLLFSERLVRHLGVKTALISRRDGFSVESNLIPGAKGRDDRVLQLQVPANAPVKPGEARHLELAVDCEPLPMGLTLDQQSLRTAVIAEISGSDGQFQSDAQAVVGLQVHSVKLEGDQLKLGIDLKRELLQTGHDYRFEIRVFPGEEAYQLPPSWLAWSLSTNEVETVLKNRGFGSNQPGRTLNLQVFLHNLRDSTFRGKEPPIGIAYLYIRAS